MPRSWAGFTARPVAGETGGSSGTRLYTRTGDRGETGLAGGARVLKDSARITAFGTYDELGASLGLAEAFLPPPATALRALLVRLQHEIYIAQSELAVPPSSPPTKHRIEERHVRRLELDIDRYSARLEPLHSFVLPRGSRAGAQLHVCRTLARRAERSLWRLNRESPLRPAILQWSNRLSDLLFALALHVNRIQKVVELPPNYST
ncbi:MAG: cob(I)yrinic acid a,c-diamide adenosyltransferase [Thermoplasmata archaeon]|nr:cob(I)yrinic acid a,c-diamide adenosyltransferase [Thermoplasmata archaeon]MCI4359454.1 cob(I)yrinic acid a,c-diamide adenosyltransferase [Thermoplasmata archaeon]